MPKPVSNLMEEIADRLRDRPRCRRFGGKAKRCVNLLQNVRFFARRNRRIMLRKFLWLNKAPNVVKMDREQSK